MTNTLVEKWPRAKALKLRAIRARLNLCGCGSSSHWQLISELLREAQSHTHDGFYRDPWFEFGAKVLDSWDLLDHGTGIGFAWLTEDGELLLEFLQDFGTEEPDMNDDSGHPFWSIEFSWTVDAKETDSYSEWAASQKS